MKLPSSFPPSRSPRLRDPLTVVTNYTDTGIGDFGRTLLDSLRAAGVEVAVEETSADGTGAAAQRRRIRLGSGPLLANVGLTGWGPSPWNNFLGFSALGARIRRGRTAVAIVHHAIEALTPEETGYPTGPLVRWGAHRALRALRGSHAVVFSPRLGTTLRERYGWTPSLTAPLPVRVRDAVAPAPDSKPRVVTAGYLAPYKGIDLFLEAARADPDPSRWAIVGGTHRVLASDPNFQRRVAAWEEQARRAGIERTGFLPETALDRLLGPGSVGVLPYTSASGSSASFSMFAERACPVVASDLPEFRYLRDAGAGVVLVPPASEEIARAVQALTSDPRAHAELAERQRSFAREHSWAEFVRRLLSLYESDGSGRPAPRPSA